MAKGFAGQYQIDELINEAWLNKHVRQAETPSRIWITGRWAMINYMHSQQKDGRKKWMIHTQPLFTDEGFMYEPEVADFGRTEFLDQLERACRGLSECQKTALAMRLSGCCHREIAKKLATTKQTAGNILRRAYAALHPWYDETYESLEVT